MLELIYKIELLLLNKRKLYSAYYLIMDKFIEVIRLFLCIQIKLKKEKGICTGGEKEIIVSVTSFPARLKTTKICIQTIMNQSVKPNRIILWLAKDEISEPEKLENEYRNLIARGLEIKYCDNLRSHKKYYYAMLENPNATIITMDDDVYYPVNTIERLIVESRKNRNAIICNVAQKISKKDFKIEPYVKWESVREYTTSNDEMICQIGVGGVLYPPHSLDENVFNKDDIKELCYHTDDLWLNAMARLKNTSIICLGNFPTLFCIGSSQKESLSKINCGENRNDLELQNIIRKYPNSF